MKNNKKVFYKNRVKCFYTGPGQNRVKEDEESLQGDLEDSQHLKDPEEEGDLS